MSSARRLWSARGRCSRPGALVTAVVVTSVVGASAACAPDPSHQSGGVGAASGLGASGGTDSADSTDSETEILLWVWRQGGDLTFLHHQSLSVGVAQWIATVRLFGGEVTQEEASSGPRLEVEQTGGAVVLDPARRSAVVVRLESAVHPGGLLADPTPARRSPRMPAPETVAQVVLALWRAQCALPHGASVGACPDLQIDFDAVVSQRGFYRELLHLLAQEVHGLSITALASWCWERGWLEELPIDYAVPMLFRLGPEAASTRRRLASGEQLVTACRGSIGFSLDEPMVAPPPPISRLALFSPAPWNAERFAVALERWHQLSRARREGEAGTASGPSSAEPPERLAIATEPPQ